MPCAASDATTLLRPSAPSSTVRFGALQALGGSAEHVGQLLDHQLVERDAVLRGRRLGGQLVGVGVRGPAW